MSHKVIIYTFFLYASEFINYKYYNMIEITII